MGRSPGPALSSCNNENGLNLKRGPWTPEEDDKLVSYIKQHGHASWRNLPKLAQLNRCGKSCRLRWTNYLRPDIKRGNFSQQEQQTILNLHSILGNKWSAIASQLPGRTDNEIKNFWNTHLRKKLIKMGLDPITHMPMPTFQNAILSNLLPPHLITAASLAVANLRNLQYQLYYDHQNLSLLDQLIPFTHFPNLLEFHESTAAAAAADEFDDQIDMTTVKAVQFHCNPAAAEPAPEPDDDRDISSSSWLIPCSNKYSSSSSSLPASTLMDDYFSDSMAASSLSCGGVDEEHQALSAAAFPLEDDFLLNFEDSLLGEITDP